MRVTNVALALTISYFVGTSPWKTAVVRFAVYPPEGSTFGYLDAGSAVSISPDGSRLAFVATRSSGKSVLWIRELDSLTARELPATDDASFPFWSPDSRFVGFFANGKLKTIDIAGGAAVTLCEAPLGRGGTWNVDGEIVFAPNAYDPLHRVSTRERVPTPVTTLERSSNVSGHRWPHFLPDGRHFLYLAWNSEQLEKSAVYIGSLDSKDTRRLLSIDSSATYAAPGYLLYVLGQKLMAQPFDANTLELTSEPVATAEPVERFGGIGPSGYTPLSVSAGGVLAYGKVVTPMTQFAWFDRKGKRLGTVGSRGYFNPRLSRDGKQVAADRYDREASTEDIWRIEWPDDVTSRLTFRPADEWVPVWSPDGDRIVFASNRGGSCDLYQMPSSDKSREELLLKSSIEKFPNDWSADGRFIVYENWDPRKGADLWVLSTRYDRAETAPTPFLETPFNEWQARFSPDGTRIAYAADDSGRIEVYVETFPTRSQRWQISNGGGQQPEWRRDGKELFYLAADRKLMAVKMNPAGRLRAGRSQALFEAPIPRFGLNDSRSLFQVTADGRRFLINTIVEESEPSPITVVLNWMTELNAPAGVPEALGTRGR